MSFQTIQLFVNIGAVGNNHHLLFQAICVKLFFQVTELLLKTLALITEDRGQMVSHNNQLLFDAHQSLLNHFGELVALALASFEKLLDCGSIGFGGGLVQGFGVYSLLLKNAGPAHNF